MKPSATPNGRIILGYLGLAFSDYLVARHLLRGGFLEHGAIMAATAVEKHLKAVIGVNGLSRSEHLEAVQQLSCSIFILKQPLSLMPYFYKAVATLIDLKRHKPCFRLT